MKKGFTLIELLAVIVILAIIAVIAVPIVINIIEDSKKNAMLRSADFYLDAVEMSVAQATLKNKNIQDGTYNILQSGNICLSYDSENKCNDELVVEVNGEVPNSGTITIEKGEIKDISITLNDKTIVKNEEGKLIYQTIPIPKSFAEDSWETIVANVKAGNLSAYNVGDTKEIELKGFTNGEENSNGLYTIRIANKTNTGDVCTKEYLEREDGTKETYSKTACGFVIEFEDIILDDVDNAKMNPTNTNVGGWKDSKMRTYVNDTIYNALPEKLKENIIETTVVSGHGSTVGETNFISTDKVYLLSTQEVWEQGTSNTITRDTARELTRQLDYYKEYKNEDGSIGVTTTNYEGAIKKYNGSANYWWLRSADSNNTYNFCYVNDNGDWYFNFALNTNGVVVAFRIG